MCAAVTARQPLLDVRQWMKVFKQRSIYGGCVATIVTVDEGDSRRQGKVS